MSHTSAIALGFGLCVAVVIAAFAIARVKP